MAGVSPGEIWSGFCSVEQGLKREEAVPGVAPWTNSRPDPRGPNPAHNTQRRGFGQLI